LSFADMTTPLRRSRALPTGRPAALPGPASF
jgi:hypothetical protein